MCFCLLIAQNKSDAKLSTQESENSDVNQNSHEAKDKAKLKL